MEVRRDGDTVRIGAPQQRAVLAALLLETGRVVSTERLIDHLWGEEPPPTARATLQSLVKRLRRTLERPPAGPAAGSPRWQILAARPPGYQIVVDRDAVDLCRFARLTGEGRQALAAGDPMTAGSRLRAALALWRGEALLDVSAEPLRRRMLPLLTERYVAAVESLIEADLALSRHAEVVTQLRGLIQDFPLRENLHRFLMLALYQSGRRAEALEAYRSLRGLLVETLGVEPDGATRRLHHEILRTDALAHA